MKKWLFLCLLVFGCNERIVNFTSSNISFQDYKTYAITNLKSSKSNYTPDGRALLSKIDSAIIQEMNRRNYAKNNTLPDLIARYELISVQQTQNLNNQPLYTANTFSNPSVFEEYALLIELIDPAKSKTVWQASVDLKRYNTNKNKERAIAKAVTSLFNTYLYQAKSNHIHPELDQSKNK
jgi:hypothetical protein